MPFTKKKGMITIRLPNKYGSVFKLSGNRRNPYAVRITTGWELNEEAETSKQIYKYLGYYPTKKEALQALAAYNEDPYDLRINTITFKEVYERWSEEHYAKVSESNVKGCKAAYKLFDSLYDKVFIGIKLDTLQKILDDSGKHTPTLKKAKIMLGLMYDYAVIHEIVKKDKRDMIRYLDINKAGNPNARKPKPFKKKEIDKLWKYVEHGEKIQIPLILIYTGLRISEFYNLKKEDVHLDERWFLVTASKTDAGVREVPIAEKIVPFFEHWMEKDSDYVFPNTLGNNHTDHAFRDSWWHPIMDELEMDHNPHDCRHTCISLLAAAGVDKRITKKIVGHQSQDVTDDVYTHFEIPIKLEAINKI